MGTTVADLTSLLIPAEPVKKLPLRSRDMFFKSIGTHAHVVDQGDLDLIAEGVPGVKDEGVFVVILPSLLDESEFERMLVTANRKPLYVKSDEAPDGYEFKNVGSATIFLYPGEVALGDEYIFVNERVMFDGQLDQVRLAQELREKWTPVSSQADNTYKFHIWLKKVLDPAFAFLDAAMTYLEKRQDDYTVYLEGRIKALEDQVKSLTTTMSTHVHTVTSAPGASNPILPPLPPFVPPHEIEVPTPLPECDEYGEPVLVLGAPKITPFPVATLMRPDKKPMSLSSPVGTPPVLYAPEAIKPQPDPAQALRFDTPIPSDKIKEFATVTPAPEMPEIPELAQ